jgi:L-2,4-diaminobutyric acid acetyltransferase
LNPPALGTRNNRTVFGARAGLNHWNVAMTGTTVRREKTRPHAMRISMPEVAHGADIHRLVAACKPLDLNSRYAYLLLCEHFAQTCALAHAGDRVVGFVSAYRPPQRDETIFIWQVAVDAGMRGLGLASAMLSDVLAREPVRTCRYLETTVSPSNTPSRRLFHGLARTLDAALTESPLFAQDAFGEEDHECEMLIRIGPFTGK